jgi:hypothetical protein
MAARPSWYSRQGLVNGCTIRVRRRMCRSGHRRRTTAPRHQICTRSTSEIGRGNT